MKIWKRTTLIFATAVAMVAASYTHASRIWISPEEIAQLPTKGEAWESVLSEANRAISSPDLSNQDDSTNVSVMAKALVYARTGDPRYRDQVVKACMDAIGTEAGGRTLALGRELIAYVIAADLVGLSPEDDARFRDWLRAALTKELDGKTLRSTHEDRPNNWGTHAGASRMAVALYLGDQAEFENAVAVFRAFLGDRSANADFKYGDLSWQADPASPVGINPPGAVIEGHDVSGVLPDDQRRGGDFSWPPPQENYVYEALQGALAQAVIASRNGYPDVWTWSDSALLRAFEWLHEEAGFPPEGDDTWETHLVNHYYGTDFPSTIPARAGKNVGWTDWTHGEGAVLNTSLQPDPDPAPEPDTDSDPGTEPNPGNGQKPPESCP